MGHHSPSARRRAGRKAFIPNENPMQHQPYKKNSWAYEFYLDDWLDGWNDAKIDYEEEQRLDKMCSKTCPHCGAIVG